MENKIKWKLPGKRLAVLLAACLTVFGCAACGSKSGGEELVSSDMAAQTESADAYDSAGSLYENSYMELEEDAGEAVGEEKPQVQDPSEGRKLITTVELEAETYSFQQLLSCVEQKTEALGGYIEVMDSYNGNMQSAGSRHANLKIRIPGAKLDEFVESVGEKANITRRTENVEDVTLQYVDLESHKKALETEQERLLDLLEQAKSLEDLLTIESRLSEVRYQLESMESQLRLLGNLVDFSTVNLSINEVKQYSEPAERTVWQRIGTGFLDSCRNVGNGLKDFLVGFIVALPYLFVAALFAGLIIGIVLLCVRQGNRKKTKKRAAAGQPWKNTMAGSQSGEAKIPAMQSTEAEQQITDETVEKKEEN